jgi:type VI secretion system secreted protein Hcp
VAIYMKFGSVDGGVTTEGFKNWIELNSFQYGVSRHVGSGAGGTTRESSAPSFSEVVVTKHLDVASSKLYQDSVAGAFDTNVTIKMTTTTKNKVETFVTYEMKHCGVSSYSTSSGGDLPMESLSLNFTNIVMTPTPLDHTGQIKKGAVVGYDLKAMKAS